MDRATNAPREDSLWDRAPEIDPITLEIIGGTIESTRREMELQIERTARSVVIREGRDYRASIFDRQCRNVSSASGAAHVDPVLQNYSLDEIEDGDVFIWNDPFKSAGGLTHLPDLCITQPIIWNGELVAYAQAFGHVSDIGGMTPGSLDPRHQHPPGRHHHPPGQDHEPGRDRRAALPHHHQQQPIPVRSSGRS